jgi:hypothetical protein
MVSFPYFAVHRSSVQRPDEGSNIHVTMDGLSLSVPTAIFFPLNNIFSIGRLLSNMKSEVSDIAIGYHIISSFDSN